MTPRYEIKQTHRAITEAMLAQDERPAITPERLKVCTGINCDFDTLTEQQEIMRRDIEGLKMAVARLESFCTEWFDSGRAGG